MSDQQATPEATDLGEIPAEGTNIDNGGVQQIPASVAQMASDPTAGVTREKLLVAIGQEADRIAGNETVQASRALVELAHAYALVATGALVGTANSAPENRAIPAIASRGADLGRAGYDAGRQGSDYR